MVVANVVPATISLAKVLEVGAGKEFSNLQAAALQAKAGDTILIRKGIYGGGNFISNLKGKPSAWITITAAANEKVIFRGGSEAIHLSDPEYVKISNLTFEDQTGNTVNIDDAASLESPAHHVIIENCIWERINATGNNDQLKISGLDEFTIRQCRFSNGSAGGSLIDMVGCHKGIIENNTFENGGSNSVQAKGGTKDITIQRNKFINGGQRAVNIGGSTGLPYFRPQGVNYEASFIKVYSNIVIGGQSAFAFVGAINSEVVNNTIIKPERWAIRILQENKGAGFLPCSNNKLSNNIVITESVQPAINIGGDTDAASFTFSNNLWFNPKNSLWTGPQTPVKELNQILNKNPMLKENSFEPEANSPVLGRGQYLKHPESDFAGNHFDTKNRSIGALEVQKIKLLFD